MKNTSWFAVALVVLVAALGLYHLSGNAPPSPVEVPAFSVTSAPVAPPDESAAKVAAVPWPAASVSAAAAAIQPSAPSSDKAPGAATESKMSRPAQVSSVQTQPTQTGDANSKSGPPSVDEVRAEVARDPEAPSKAILRYSVGLEVKMETALQSEKSAGELFPELDSCASNSGPIQLAESARSLCLSDASRLADKYSSLKPRYENLETRTDPRVVKMKKLMDVR